MGHWLDPDGLTLLVFGRDERIDGGAQSLDGRLEQALLLLLVQHRQVDGLVDLGGQRLARRRVEKHAAKAAMRTRRALEQAAGERRVAEHDGEDLKD